MYIVTIIIVCFLFLFISLRNKDGVPVSRKRKPEVIGAIGEKAIANRLDGLPEEYDIFNDVMIEHGSSTTQIDHIVVSVYGIFVIETKNMHGRVYGSVNSEYWSQYLPETYYRNREYRFRNPFWQNEGHIKALRRVLGDYSVPIHGIVVFPNEAELNVNNDGSLLHRNELLSYILSFQDKLMDDETAGKYSALIGAANVTDEGKRAAHLDNVNRSREYRNNLVSSGRCPKCGGMLVERHGQYGRFLGCSNYPQCKYILNKQ